jgi:glycosyltransferase involved in cell wall biosynthesis
MTAKKKIVFIINNFLVGGVEKLIFDIVSSLDKEKYDIKIITVFGTGPLETSFRSLGIPIYFAGLPESFSKKLPADFSWLITTFFITLRVAFFLFKSKPDIVISSLFQADVIGMTAAKIIGVKKRILIQHDTVRFIEFIRMVKKNFALRFATQVVSVSETVKSFLIEYFEVKEKKIVTIFNGIDYERFKKGEKTYSGGSMPIIGILGRLEEIKGHIYALEALEILKEKYRLSPIVLIGGDGALRNSLEEYVLKNNLSSIKFLGSISDVPDFLSKIDILIIPSLNEGFCLVVIEGMVSGKVVVASDLEVMHELIKDGENGILFKKNDSEDLVFKIKRLMDNPNLILDYKKGIDVWVKKFENEYNIKNVVDKYSKLFL